MSSNTKDQLREAVALAKAGNAFEARMRVDDILRQEPDNADAWLVMAQLHTDKEQALRCMKQVVRLRPDDPRAKKIVARMEKEIAPAAAEGEGDTTLASVQTGTLKKGFAMDRQMMILSGAAALLLIVLLIAIVAALGRKPQQTAAPAGNAGITGPTATGYTLPPPSTPRPRETETPVPFIMDPDTLALNDLLRSMILGATDQTAWMVQNGLLDEAPVAEPRNFAQGSTETFTVILGDRFVPMSFTLEYQNAVVNMWVQDGINVDGAALRQAADTFATNIYPTVRDVFGHEVSPGIDGVAQLNVFNVSYLGANVGGYFFPADAYPTEVYEYSNEMEAFYMSLYYGEVGSVSYMSTLAHEFQHMVRFNQDRNEANWMDEGMAQLATRIVGYNDNYNHMNYLFDSRVTLNGWSPDFRTSASHYGAGYLFNQYLWERFGTDTIREIAQRPENGLQAVDAVLTTKGSSSDDVFADWIVANYINNIGIGDGRYGYRSEQLIPICPRVNLGEAQVQRRESSLPQYSAHYLELEGEGEFNIRFKGNTDVQLMDANPYSGKFVWWSNRENRSVTSLTRAFDLTNVEKATLQYWTWFEIQEVQDQGYVLISTDGGASWDFLEGDEMNRASQFDYAAHYTGNSSAGSQGLWINDSIDLTPWAGKQVMIKFQYVTDTYFEGSGWAIDNVRIPEISYFSDMETAEDGWIAEGWVRSANHIPQNWTVSIIRYDGDQPTVERLAINPDGSTSTTITLSATQRRATIIVGAMAPITGLDATYQFSVSGSGRMDSLRTPPGVLLQDDFERPCSSFYSFVLPDYSMGYREGVYEMRLDIADNALISWGEADYTNVVIDIDTVQKIHQEDSVTGIICRYLDDNNFYVFQIAQDGTYQILKVRGGGGEALVDWTESEHIRTGPGAANHLSVTCNNDRLVFNVNGEVLALITDPQPLYHGDVAFYAATGETPGIIVTFDNLVVKKP